MRLGRISLDSLLSLERKDMMTEEFFIFDDCPFCNSPNVQPNSTNPQNKEVSKVYWVICLSCWASGPEAASMEEAIERWDARARKPKRI